MAQRKKICMIYTGGTIGMVRSEHGYIPDSAAFRRQLDLIGDLSRSDMPEWELVEFSPLLDSSDIAVAQWNQLAGLIAERYNQFDGFVVLHGTDTMAYTASALSFMLKGLNKPVIFTGAQIPLCELRSDGRENIVTAMIMAADGRAREVCVYFNGRLLRGNRSTKQSSDQLAAFASPNAPALAKAGITIEYTEQALRPANVGPLELCRFDQSLPIGLIRVFPGIQFELFESIMTDKLRGVVLETFGAGNVPSSGKSLLHIIEKAYRRGTIITVCSQCMQGTVSLGAYATSQALRQIGAVDGGDMTTEAALTKLYYLFSLGLDKAEIKRLMMCDLRGERSV